MDISLFITIAIGAGTGSAIVQLIIQLGLGHWLQKRYHSYTLMKADRRNCADRIIDLISSKNYQNWADPNNDIYHTAYKLSDKLLSLGEKVHSKTLDEYVSARRYAQETVMRVLSGTSQKSEEEREFLDSQHKVDQLREKLIKAAEELKKK